MRITRLKKPLDRDQQPGKSSEPLFVAVVVDDDELLDYTSSK
jgi:hypothetical protein